MENKSEAIRLVTDLVERANNQANTIDSQKENLIKLNKQLEDKYSTETHLLVKRETLGEFAEKFEELSGEFGNLNGLLEDISSYTGNICDDVEYHDADRYRDWAEGYADDIRNLLNKETEEVE
tara:strand:+ start:1970 stop:2338 length:369 start_codon:yes stop_codon:yes gene_type:complete